MLTANVQCQQVTILDQTLVVANKQQCPVVQTIQYYTCECTHIYIYTYIHVYTYKYIYIYKNIHVVEYIIIIVKMYVIFCILLCMHACMHACMRAGVSVCMYVCMYVCFIVSSVKWLYKHMVVLLLLYDIIFSYFVSNQLWYICICVYMCIYAYLHIYIYIRTARKPVQRFDQVLCSAFVAVHWKRVNYQMFISSMWLFCIAIPLGSGSMKNAVFTAVGA